MRIIKEDVYDTFKPQEELKEEARDATDAFDCQEESKDKARVAYDAPEQQGYDI